MRRWYLLLAFLSLGLSARTGAAVDVRMESVTARDARSVEVTYEVVDGPLPRPATVSILRSAGSSLDPATASLLMTVELTETSSGQHIQIIPLADRALALNPELPFVFAVADLPAPGSSTGAIAESNETNNIAYYRKHTVAVIIHGFTTGDTLPEWVPVLAQLLQERGYAQTVTADWAEQSREFRTGTPREYAPELNSRLSAAINNLSLEPADSVDVHWIAYSRGVSVLSACLELTTANSSVPASSQRGWTKITLIDPHPCVNRETPQRSISPLGPIGPLAGFYLWLFQETVQDPEVTFPDGVIAEGEHFYQQNAWYDLSFRENGFEVFINLWGESSLPGITAGQRYDVTWRRQGHMAMPDVYIQRLVAPSEWDSHQPTPGWVAACQSSLESARQTAIVAGGRVQASAAVAWETTKSAAVTATAATKSAAVATWTQGKAITSDLVNRGHATTVYALNQGRQLKDRLAAVDYSRMGRHVYSRMTSWCPTW